MATIKKRTTKVTKEALAKKIFKNMILDKKEAFRELLGKILLGEVKNFYSTKIYKTLIKDLTENERAVVTYICVNVSKKEDVFENMEDLTLTEE